MNGNYKIILLLFIASINVDELFQLSIKIRAYYANKLIGIWSLSYMPCKSLGEFLKCILNVKAYLRHLWT